MTNSNQKPVAKVSMYPITAAIWKNSTDDGKNAFYSFTLERTYKKIKRALRLHQQLQRWRRFAPRQSG